MKKILQITGILLAAGIIYLALMTFDIYLKIGLKLAVYSGEIFIAGFIAGAVITSIILSKAGKKIKAYERELERTSVKGQQDASKAEVLASKVKTLETALNSVLAEKAKLEEQLKKNN